MNSLLLLAGAGLLGLPWIALWLAIALAGARLTPRRFAVLSGLLSLTLLLAACSYVAVMRTLHFSPSDIDSDLRYGLGWLIGLALAAGTLTYWYLRAQQRCPQWRALCAALLVALTLTAGLAGAAYFYVQAHYATGWDHVVARAGPELSQCWLA